MSRALSAPGLVTGNIIDGQDSDGQVVGPVPEPGTLVLLVTAGLGAPRLRSAKASGVGASKIRTESSHPAVSLRVALFVFAGKSLASEVQHPADRGIFRGCSPYAVRNPASAVYRGLKKGGVT